MNVTFDMTRDDFDAQLAYIRKRITYFSGMKTWCFFSNILTFFFWGLGGVMLFDFYRHYQGKLTRLLVLGFGAVILGIIVYILMSHLGRRRFNAYLLSETGITLGPHGISLTDGGIIERTPFSEMLTKWTGIQGVEHTTKHIGIFTDNASCIWVPKRAFSSESEIKNFLTTIQSHERTTTKTSS